MCHDQLPPGTIEVYETPLQSKKRGPFDDFPSVHYHNSKMQRNNLEELETILQDKQGINNENGLNDLSSSYGNMCEFKVFLYFN